MTNFDLQATGFQELELVEIVEIDGGNIWWKAAEYAVMAYDAGMDFVDGFAEGWKAQ